MNLKRMSGTVKRLVDSRGGPDAVRADAKRLQGALRGRGGAKGKVRAAADALRAHDRRPPRG